MEECIFCKIAAGKARSWKVAETEHAVAFFDIRPVNRFHTLVIPKKHFANIFDVPEHELREVIALVRQVARLYEEKLGIRNIQIFSNSGAEAQQDVFHLHFHVLPRHNGDGQSTRWKGHPEWSTEFNQWLEKLR